MIRSPQSMIGAALLALAAAGAAAAAHAADVYFTVGVQLQPVHAPAGRVVHVAPPPVYDAPPAYGYEQPFEHERRWRRACRAPGWDPQVRYLPGQAVWREGSLYVATRLSASVWNVNSPPEWTPSYWRPARCR